MRIKNFLSAVLGILCLDCGWFGVSWYRHDYKGCSCPNEATVDGGRDYFHYGAKNLKRVVPIQIQPAPKDS